MKTEEKTQAELLNELKDLQQEYNSMKVLYEKEINGLKQAEEALAKEQFLINALMNNLTDHVYFKDLESRFIRNNRAHALSFGLVDPEQVIGKKEVFSHFQSSNLKI